MNHLDRLAHIGVICSVSIGVSIVAHPAFAGWPHDPENGNVALCIAPNDQVAVGIGSDGTGGAIFAWSDLRGGTTYDIYAQRVGATGTPLWTSNGVALSTAAGDQFGGFLIPDGAGGAIVTWFDNRSGNWDVYAQRVNAAGVPQWAPNGVAICTAGNDQTNTKIASDGAGGAIIAWDDNRAPNGDIYAQRVNAAGAPQWTPNGVAICSEFSDQHFAQIVSDGAGGAIVAWQEYRNGPQDIYAQRVNASGVPQWTTNGVGVCTAANDQVSRTITTDGSGGAIIAWYDFRTGGADIYVQRMSAAGVPQWTANGVALCTAAGTQQAAAIVAGGLPGSAIVTWEDYRGGGTSDIYAQRVSAGGLPQWTPDGVALCTAPTSQGGPMIASDGSGGAIVAWFDFRNGNNDIYAQRLTAAGTPQWAVNGVALCVASGNQSNQPIVSDGAGGAIVYWGDNRNGAESDLYAQRVDHFGQLGNAEPAITRIRDLPADQGGLVRLDWNASYLDADPDYAISNYWIWRQAPLAQAEQAVQNGAHWLDSDFETQPGAVSADADRISGKGIYMRAADNVQFAWEYLGSQPASGFLSYSYVAATTRDSLGASNPYTAFMVQARAATNVAFWNSSPDSGYSVDNLPPATPAPFNAEYVAGATQLHWGENHEADLVGYRLFRGSTSGFTPSPGNLISAQSNTGYSDVGPAGSWYKLSAIDIHGNESPYAVLGPNGTLDVLAPGSATVYFLPPAPNPARDDGVMFRFGLPAESAVSLAVFDQLGRKVREVTRGTLPAGEHRCRWDGRDGSGREIAAGIYFARLEAGGRTLRMRFVFLR